MIKMQAKDIEFVGVNSLIPHPKNMNEHSAEQIERLIKLIEYQGFRNPIVVQKGTNLIVAGHGRLMAAKKMGIEKVPVTYQEFDSEAQLYAYMVSDNAIASWAELDLSAINNEMLDLGPDFDVELLGIQDFVIEPAEKYDEATQDEVPETLPEPKVVRGEVYILGKHRLMCGDSTAITDIDVLMNGAKADLVFTDPPYGFNYVQKSTGESIVNDGVEFAEIIYQAITNIKAQEYFICGDFRTAGELLSKISHLGRPKSCIVWVKPIQHRMHKFEMCHEFVWFFGKNGSPFYASNVFEEKREIEKHHPTIKPVSLVEFCLKSSDFTSVVDLFGGSGTTLISCEKINRNCFLMEIDPQYCQVILDRWQKFTGKKAYRESDNKPWDEIREA